jgi:hypothetical protein
MPIAGIATLPQPAGPITSWAYLPMAFRYQFILHKSTCVVRGNLYACKGYDT